MLQREQPTMSLRIGALLAGLIIGVLIGVRFFAPASAQQPLTAEQQEYIVMLSTLYNDANPKYDDGYIAQRLDVLGDLPSVVARMKTLAQQYSKDSDANKQQAAKSVDQLAANMQARIDNGVKTTPAPVIGVAQQQTTPGSQTNQTPAVTPASSGITPKITPASPNNPNPPPQQSNNPNPPQTTPAANAPNNPPAVAGKTGTLVSTGGGINVRTGPNSSAALVKSLPAGTKVDIIQIVDGEAVDGTEKRWYQIKAGDVSGYVYFKLMKPD